MKETGKIIIRSVKKGVEYKVELINKKGKPYEALVHGYEFESSLNDKACEVEKNGNNIEHIWVEGKEILPKQSQKNKVEKKLPGYEKINTVQQIALQNSAPSISDSFAPLKTRLPYDTKTLLINLKNIDNFYLKFFKAARFEEDKKGDKIKFYQRDTTKGDYEIRPVFPDIFNTINDRYRQSLKNLYNKLTSFTLKPEGRMVIGLGGESVYEVSMTLHYIYGFPYIPASAIKGITRSWIITEKFNSNEKEAFKDQGFCDIFGCPKDSFYSKAHQGKVFFLDAFPQKKPEIEVDVMNPHYSPYYTEGKPPGDYYNPIPIFFLTVKNTPFEFHIGINKNEGIKSGIFAGKTYLEVAEEWIKKALSEHGIGAKTSVGYGTME